MRYGHVLIPGIASILSAALLLGCSHPSVEDKAKMSNVKTDTTTVERHGIFAVLETSMGTMEAELYPEDAPKTVANFVGLAEEHYYDGVIFHRISKGFVIQGGDPTGKGTGGKTFTGKPLDDELDPSTSSYKAGYMKGVLAMANKGRPSTGTSQFFIMLDDITRLPKDYSIFGKVIAGLDVVDAIGQAAITPELGPTDGRPKSPIVIKHLTIHRYPEPEKK
jgi:cyclophilin family peptidyl-prolyl cis-trans isomerase